MNQDEINLDSINYRGIIRDLLKKLVGNCPYSNFFVVSSYRNWKISLCP